MVAADVVGRGGGGDLRPDGGRLEVLEFVVIGGGEMGAHGAVFVGDDHAASPCGVFLRDVVFDVETCVGRVPRRYQYVLFLQGLKM